MQDAFENKTILKEDCQKSLEKLNLQDFCHKFFFLNSFTQIIPLNYQNTLSVMKGLLPKKIQAWGLKTWNFHGYWKNRTWKFHRLIKKDFLELLWVIVFGLGISRGLTQFCGIHLFSFSFVGLCSIKYMVLRRNIWHSI